MENKKTIGILALDDGDGGGVSEYIRSVIDSLKNNKNFEIVILTRHSKVFDIEKEQKQIEIPVIKSNLITKFFRAFSFFLPMVPSSLLLSKNELDLFRDIDLFFCPYISPYPHYFLKKKFVYTLHDLQEFYLYSFFSIKQHLIRRVINYALTRSAELIICESEFVKKDILKFFGVKNEKVQIIQAPPSSRYLKFEFNPKLNFKVVEKYSLPKRYFFYPAQFWKHKNHLRLIRAFNKIANEDSGIFLVLSGSRKKNEVFNEILLEIKKLNLNKRIVFLGYIQNKEMPYIYKNSICLVMPSLFESISIPVFEAFSLGVPVLSSNILGLQQQVKGAGILFNPYDEKEIFNSLKNALNNKVILEENSIKGYNRIKKVNQLNFKSQLNFFFKKLL